MSLDVTGSKRCGPRHPQWVALGAVALLDEALALWCGPAYAEFADCDRPEDVAVRCLQLGAADRAVTSLEALIAGHPVRERARGLLMSAAGLVLPAELLPFAFQIQVSHQIRRSLLSSLPAALAIRHCAS